MKVTGYLPSAELALAGDEAARLEALGYDGLTTSEIAHDPFLPLAVAAHRTQRLELMTAIAVAFARNPMLLANVGHDLNAASKGRFTLGLGTQVAAHITHRFSMPWSHPARRMGEMIAAMHAIWDAWYDGKPLDFRGEFYTHSLMTPYFTPTDIQHGRPRVMLAAVGPLMTRTAAERADGLICHAFNTARYFHEVTSPLVEATLAEHGRDRKSFSVMAQLFTAMGDTDEEIERGLKEVRRTIGFYGSTPAYRGVLECHGWGDLQPRLRELSKQGKWEEMGALITDDIVEGFAVIGSPEQVARKLVDAFGGKADWIPSPFSRLDPERQAELVKILRSA